jgi:hypothetical protein
MIDQQALLQVLTGVGEVQAQQLGVAAGTVVVDDRASRTRSPPRLIAKCRSTASRPRRA